MTERADIDLTQSTKQAFAVVLDADIIPPSRGLYIGGAGTIRVTHKDDTTATDYPTTIAGSVYPWSVKKVHTAGTTATNIIVQR